MEIGLDMATDADALTRDMVKFATFLRLLRLPELAQNYENIVTQLRADSSTRSVNEVRARVSRTLEYGGSGSVYDRYVQKQDGSLDRVLNAEYRDVLQRLTVFANGN